MVFEAATGAIAEKEQELVDLAQKIWDCPELAYNEVKACGWTAAFLRSCGFTVQEGCFGVPTAIRATWGHGRPVIGFLGEYDALPEQSQRASTVQEPVKKGAPGHACGHNLLGVACLGAVLGAKADLESNHLEGTVVFYGCPAEEVITGKVFLARAGAFRELDLSMSWHGSNANKVYTGTHVGLNSVIFHFKGHASHAGSAPHQGRSALDACEIMNVGVNYLREHVNSDVRMSYSYMEAGSAPNIVPEKASLWYYIRALDREALEAVYERVVRCAKGAACMTETEMSIEFIGGCYNSMPNRVIAQAQAESLEEVDKPQYTDAELAFADELNKQSPLYEQLRAAGALDDGPINTKSLGIVEENSYSTGDSGDVMHIVPHADVYTSTRNIAGQSHGWQTTACAGMSIGYKGMLYGSRVLANTAGKFFRDPQLVQKAQEEFQCRMGKQVYQCPIPDEIAVPRPQQVS